VVFDNIGAMSAPRMLILTSEYPPFLWGGVGRYTVELERTMRKHGYVVDTVCVPSYAMDNDVADKATNVADPGHLFADAEFAALLRAPDFDVGRYRIVADRIAEAVLQRTAADIGVIFLQDFYNVRIAVRLGQARPSAMRLYFSHLPLSARFSYFEKSGAEERQQALEATAILWAERVFAPSDFARRSLCAVHSIAPDRVTVAKLGTTMSQFEHSPRAGAPMIVSVGRFTEQKGWDSFLRIVEKLQRIPCRCHYVVVGDGDLRPQIWHRLTELVPNEFLSLHRHLTPDRELVRLLQRADIFVQLSSYETFGLASLEAAALGVVPVVAAVGAIPELFPESSGAILVSPGDVDAAVAAITKLLANPTEQVARAAQLRRHAARFTWDDHLSVVKRASWGPRGEGAHD
jgi:glycosyltransferase involved in cell wall biosynthesis